MPRLTDTPRDIEEVLRRKMMAHSGEERFIMGAEMFESAREMVMASLPKDLSEAEKRRLLFKRLYGTELKIGRYGINSG